LIDRCREIVALVECAESYSMACWLDMRPDGWTVKAAYAEAARLMSEVDWRLRGEGVGAQARTRDRRPALMIARELRECLSRVAGRIEAADERQVRDITDALSRVRALLHSC
jgi:hypothetical protein